MKILSFDNIGFVEMMDHLGDDLTVVNSARVSFGKYVNSISEKDEKLIKYLYNHNHWTPFAHVIFQFRIKMPFFVARQWFRHQIGLTRNEISRRYVSDQPQFFEPDYFRVKTEDKKQGSLDIKHEKSSYYIDRLKAHYSSALDLYDDMIANNIPAEQARMVLPMGAYTEFIETGSLAAYMRIYKLRVSLDAQKETSFYIKAIFSFMREFCPVSISLIE
jgi:thymidylate synthase (FAD)